MNNDNMQLEFLVKIAPEYVAKWETVRQQGQFRDFQEMINVAASLLLTVAPSLLEGRYLLTEHPVTGEHQQVLVTGLAGFRPRQPTALLPPPQTAAKKPLLRLVETPPE